MSEMEKTTLAKTLERFNRKERNLLFRALLGQEERLKLAEKFREDVFSVLKINVAANAWWATDYHINWLAGALTVYTDGNECLNEVHSNAHKNERALVEGNQEDIDLVIASGLDLILIEAKAYGSWDNEQIKSKLARLELLHAYYSELAKHANVANHVQMHFLLMSPTPPKRITSAWPEWAKKGSEIPWIKLTLPQGVSILEVNRCNEAGERAAKSDHWRIAELKAAHDG